MRDTVSVDLALVANAYDAFLQGEWGRGLSLLRQFVQEKRILGETERLDWATRLIQRRMRWIRERLIEEALGKWKNGDFANRDAYDEFLENRATSLMLTRQDAQYYLAVSENCDAVVDKLDIVPQSGNAIEWELAAACALEQDARDELNLAHHIDGAMDPPQVKSDWCEACERWRPMRDEFPFPEYVCDECSEP